MSILSSWTKLATSRRTVLNLEQLEIRVVPGAVADLAMPLVIERALESRNETFIYQDANSGLNIPFASGWFGDLGKLHPNAFAIDDPANVVTGTTTDPNAFSARGTVFQFTVDAFTNGPGFAGVNFEFPEHWGSNRSGPGIDLRGVENIVLEVRCPHPGGMRVQFGFGGSVTPFITIPQSATFSVLTIPISSLTPAITDLSNVHILFAVSTNNVNAPNGGTVLLDNIRLDPPAPAIASLPSLPRSNSVFGVVPRSSPDAGRVPFPPDQVLANIATIYEAGIALVALCDRGLPGDLEAARRIADGLVYAFAHDNRGLPIPGGGPHSAYMSGPLPLLADQSGGAHAGDSRLAGFSCGTTSPTGFCLVLDGITGGNAALAMMGLARAAIRFGDVQYLVAARAVGQWIVDHLTDTTGTGFGGYFLGFPDEGLPKVLLLGKSIENNADIASAFLMLAAAERRVGNFQAAAIWEARAFVGGDFVMAMYDAVAGRFNAGTVPVGQPPGPGITPNGPARGNDVINTFDFLDSTTFPFLALATHPRYRHQIDWRVPLRYAQTHFGVTVTAAGRSFTGFSLTSVPTSGPAGVAWEFTAQMALALDLAGRLYKDPQMRSDAATIRQSLVDAQRFAPFGDGRGLVAATLQDGDRLPPAEQCLSTPFQCIAMRVGLAATVFAIFADLGINPFVAPDDSLVVGSGAGAAPWVKHLFADGSVRREFLAYSAGFRGGVRVALGDVNGDGVRDIVTAPGPGGGPHVRVWDGVTGAELRGFFAYSPAFRGGVSVAMGDVDGDGRAEIITGAGAGGGPHVRVWNALTGAEIRGFFAFPLGFSGGVMVAAGDIDGDGRADIVTGAGPGGGPHVRVWNALTGIEQLGWFAYDIGFRGGVAVATGDVDGDGLADIITGPGISGGPHVRGFSGLTAREVVGLIALTPSFTGGVTVAAVDVDGDEHSELVVAPGPGGSGTIEIWDGPNERRRVITPFDPGFLGGVFVGGG